MLVAVAHVAPSLGPQSSQGSINLLKEAKISKLTITRVGDFSRKDNTLKKLEYLVKNGFPDIRKDLDNELKPFWNF